MFSRWLVSLTANWTLNIASIVSFEWCLVVFLQPFRPIGICFDIHIATAKWKYPFLNGNAFFNCRQNLESSNWTISSLMFVLEVRKIILNWIKIFVNVKLVFIFTYVFTRVDTLKWRTRYWMPRLWSPFASYSWTSASWRTRLQRIVVNGRFDLPTCWWTWRSNLLTESTATWLTCRSGGFYAKF